jgi:WD40 repeat protein
MKRLTGLALIGSIAFGTTMVWAADTPAPSQYSTSSGGRSFTGFLSTFTPRPPAVKHLVYAAEPGGTANGSLPYPNGGVGIVVLDADHGYRFVKRIGFDVPASLLPGSYATGITASPATNMLYVAFRTPGYLVAYDLATDKVAWTWKGEPKVDIHYNLGDPTGCCERPWMLPDGKTILVTSSYNNFSYLVDGETGKMLAKIDTPETPVQHNLAVTPDGKTAFISAIAKTVSVVDVPSRKVVRTITYSDFVRPLTINHTGSRVYANLNNLLGFEIGDGKTGKIIKRVEAPAELWKAKWADPTNRLYTHGCPSHGIAITPDESEIWIIDSINTGVMVWDNKGNDNWEFNPSKGFKTNHPSGWVSMTNDGKTAFLGSGDIVDVKTHKIIGQMKDEHGDVLATEKSLLLALQGGKLIETNNQFAVGLPEAVAATGSSRRASN